LTIKLNVTNINYSYTNILALGLLLILAIGLASFMFK